MLAFFSSSYAQTKEETFEYIKNKLKDIALQDIDAKHVYSIGEMTNSSPNTKIIVANVSNIQPTVISTFAPKNFRSIITVEKSNTTWLKIICDEKSVNLLDKDSNGKIFIWDTTSSITFILNKGTQKEEIDRLKKAFYHLMKLYGYEKKDLFD